MSNRAILVGNVKYRNMQQLDCCRDDVEAIRRLLEVTGKYEEIEVVEDASADILKERVRGFADRGKRAEEVFFYFTGHGHQHEAEFFFCATDFDEDAPNQTGLSTTELHTLLRLADADVIVKVIDACHSGTLLVKSADALGRQPKDGFRSIVQIASCMDDQGSLTGDPLSVFTEQFRDAALRKSEGVVYYTDIIDTLRDRFINNHSQTPFFISQGTGREQFVADAKRLEVLRASLKPPAAPAAVAAQTPRTRTALEILQAAEAKSGTKATIKHFTDKLFDGLRASISEKSPSDLFEVAFLEHSVFVENSTRAFIIRCLSKEVRPDDFVTAEVRRERKRQPAWQLGLSAIQAQLAGYWDEGEVVESFDLRLNCKMDRAQLRVEFTPKFANLKRIVLIVSAAPSLEACYVFEFASLHALKDIGEYNHDGDQIYRHWHVRKWDHDPTDLVSSIAKNLTDALAAHVKATAERLTK